MLYVSSLDKPPCSNIMLSHFVSLFQTTRVRFVFDEEALVCSLTLNDTLHFPIYAFIFVSLCVSIVLMFDIEFGPCSIC